MKLKIKNKINMLQGWIFAMKNDKYLSKSMENTKEMWVYQGKLEAYKEILQMIINEDKSND